MGSLTSRFIQDLVAEEIDRVVFDAARDGATLSTSATAEKIARTYPSSGLDQEELIKRIILAAIAAGVPLEIGASHSDQVAVTSPVASLGSEKPERSGLSSALSYTMRPTTS